MTIQEMTQPEQDKLATIMRLAALDKTFRWRLLRNPRAVFAEVGIVFPENVEIVAHDTPRNAIGISLPAPQWLE